MNQNIFQLKVIVFGSTDEKGDCDIYKWTIDTVLTIHMW